MPADREPRHPAGNFADKLTSAEPALTFDDVLILPGYSEIAPRSVSLASALTSTIRLPIPIIAASMRSIFNATFAVRMTELGGTAIVPAEPLGTSANAIAEIKAHQIDVQLYPTACVDRTGKPVVGAAVSADHVHRAEQLVSHGADFLVLETAHAEQRRTIEAATFIKRNLPVELIVGNLVTPEAAERFAAIGVDALKVGIGQGSTCTTSRVTGVGAPLLTAVAQVADAVSGSDMRIIADGGIRTSGDIVKALSVGADAVCLGNLLARASEASGETQMHDGVPYRRYGANPYRSLEFTHDTGIPGVDRLLDAHPQDDLWVEGASGLVPIIGPLHLILTMLCRGMQGGFGFVGAHNVEELRHLVRFVLVSQNTLQTSLPHSLCNVKSACT